MKSIPTSLFVILLVVAPGCGGSSGGGMIPALTASFVAGNPIPGTDTVSMARASLNGDEVTLSVNVTGTNDVYSAAFDVVFNPPTVVFVGHAPGNLLEDGGNAPTYQAVAQAGRVVVGASRVGSVPGANAVGSRPLINLTFRVTRVGNVQVTLENAALLDQNLNPIPAINWSGGTLQAQ